MNNASWIMRFFIPMAAAVVFVGCAHLNDRPGSSQEELIQRVNTYWDAKIKDQVEVAYSIEHPEGRKKVPIYRYAGMNFSPQQASTKLLSFKILAVDLQEDRAVVSIQQEVMITAPVLRTKLKLVRDDKWFKIDGEWYHEFKDVRAMSDAIIQYIQKRRQMRSK
ncbi:MAG: hypothetical protein JRG73_09000 [Deltaproteobacteria bacterium]|nr:hypothetical protein [Deltaproteobacteria bacterium]MBW2307058.1 hypothetical protein [Deltaproteobacteria bacterium]